MLSFFSIFIINDSFLLLYLSIFKKIFLLTCKDIHWLKTVFFISCYLNIISLNVMLRSRVKRKDKVWVAVSNLSLPFKLIYRLLISLLTLSQLRMARFSRLFHLGSYKEPPPISCTPFAFFLVSGPYLTILLPGERRPLTINGEITFFLIFFLNQV